MSTNGATVAALSFAGYLTATPFGLSGETIGIGTLFCVVGVAGRAAFELQKSSEGNGAGMKWNKILGWVGGGLIGAPFMAILYLVMLKLANIQSDGIAAIGLLFVGFSGPRAVTWLLSSATSLLTKRGLSIPVAADNSQGDAKS